MSEPLREAIFAAGCFWGVEATFRKIPGVTDTQVGYTGGSVAKPSYEQVCTGTTGHAEACRVTYDPAQISYAELLRVFFNNHDPTTKDRQGPDIGSQYRSAIFFQDESEKETAQKIMQELEKIGSFRAPIVTTLEPADAFWPAEEYHQCYLAKQGLS